MPLIADFHRELFINYNIIQHFAGARSICVFWFMNTLFDFETDALGFTSTEGSSLRWLTRSKARQVRKANANRENTKKWRKHHQYASTCTVLRKCKPKAQHNRINTRNVNTNNTNDYNGQQHLQPFGSIISWLTTKLQKHIELQGGVTFTTFHEHVNYSVNIFFK